jgi:hypothetical protein
MHHRAREAWRRHSTEMSARSWALGLTAEEPQIYDVITLESVPASDTYHVDCSQGHRIAIKSLYQSVTMHLGDRLLPACPQANGEDGCGHVLSQREIEEVFNLHYDTAPPSTEDVKRFSLRQVCVCGRRVVTSYPTRTLTPLWARWL